MPSEGGKNDTGPCGGDNAIRRLAANEEKFLSSHPPDITSRSSINKKKAMLQDLQTQYQNLADYQSFEWVVAAVYRIADLYAEFAQMIYKVPEPKGLDDEELDMYVTQIEDMGLQFENIAIQRYEQAVGESRRLKVTNEWSKRALVAINKFKPDDYPLFKEEKSKTVFSPTYTLDNRAPQGR